MAAVICWPPSTTRGSRTISYSARSPARLSVPHASEIACRVAFKRGSRTISTSPPVAWLAMFVHRLQALGRGDHTPHVRVFRTRTSRELGRWDALAHGDTKRAVQRALVYLERGQAA